MRNDLEEVHDVFIGAWHFTKKKKKRESCREFFSMISYLRCMCVYVWWLWINDNACVQGVEYRSKWNIKERGEK